MTKPSLYHFTETVLGLGFECKVISAALPIHFLFFYEEDL